MELCYNYFDKHISNVCSSSYFHIRALRHIRPFLDYCRCYCWFQIRLCQFQSHQHFFSQYPSSLARSKLLGSSHYSLNYQHHLSSKFTSLASNSATNQFSIGYSCPPFTPQRWPSILVIFTTSLYAIASASLCLPQSRHIQNVTSFIVQRLDETNGNTYMQPHTM